jgi:sister chromatid cohesion protein PDS5
MCRIQDPVYHVRHEYLRKLLALLSAQKLPAQFNVIPFLTVHDPEEDVYNTVRKIIDS